MTIAAIIIGIDGWEQYTKPLVQSIWEHEPGCRVVVIDNASNEPYPITPTPDGRGVIEPRVAGLRRAFMGIRTERLCYSAAINVGKANLSKAYDWYIVLSNDVLCTGPFAHLLAEYGDGDVLGPLMKEELGFAYLEGWCVCVPARAWEAWDERFLGSDYEDVAFSTRARQRCFGLIEEPDLPFTHLDQRQRYSIVEDFAGKNAHNRELFLREYAAVRA
jgi:hypothetical protein